MRRIRPRLRCVVALDMPGNVRAVAAAGTTAASTSEVKGGRVDEQAVLDVPVGLLGGGIGRGLGGFYWHTKNSAVGCVRGDGCERLQAPFKGDYRLVWGAGRAAANGVVRRSLRRPPQNAR